MTGAYILDEYGDTASATNVNCTAKAIRFYREHGIKFDDVIYDSKHLHFVYDPRLARTRHKVQP